MGHGGRDQAELRHRRIGNGGTRCPLSWWALPPVPQPLGTRRSCVPAQPVCARATGQRGKASVEAGDGVRHFRKRVFWSPLRRHSTPFSRCVCCLDRLLRGNLTLQRKEFSGRWHTNEEGKEGDPEGTFWNPRSMRPRTHSLEKVHRVLPREATRLCGSSRHSRACLRAGVPAGAPSAKGCTSVTRGERGQDGA